MKFSVVLIARNESKTLPRLVESLKDFQSRGGEIILLDTGSTDDTAKVARDLGCYVKEVQDKFRITIDKKTADAINAKYVVEGDEPVIKEGDSLFNYAGARNYAATLASNDMIATPDCDEIYTKLDLDAINAKIEAGTQQFEYQFVFAHDALGKPLVQFLHSKFYNRVNLKWVGIIHEVLSGNAKREYLPEEIIKLEHYQNVETNRNGYLIGLALDCFKNPENDRNAHYFARELMYKNRFKSAIKVFQMHIDMNKWPEERAQSMLYTGECHSYLGDTDEMFKWYLKALDVCPTRREPLMKLAEYYYRKNSPKHAIMYAEAALTITGSSFYSNYQPYYAHLPHELLYWAYWHEGNKAKSKEHFDIAFSIEPNNPKYIKERIFYYPEKDDLAFTGERVVVDKMAHRPDILKEHTQRYEFAKKYTKGNIVLDAACGTGYGKEILEAAGYMGIDISEEAIAYAKKHYGDGFLVADLEDPAKSVDPIPDVDVIISFETIEHLQDPNKFLAWVSKHCETFIFSIPVNMPSEFHKQVYTIDQIKGLIQKHFKTTTFFSQTDDIHDMDDSAKYVVGVAYAKGLPTVSIIIPTLGRPEGLQRCLDSIKKLNYPKELIEVQIQNGESTVPEKVRTLVANSTGELIVFGSNDIEFEKDSISIAVSECDQFLAFNTGIVIADKGNICEHFMIHKDLIPKLDKGEIFSTDMKHVGVDNYLWAQVEKLGYAYKSEKAVIFHHHFTKGAEFDEVYAKGWNPENVKKDRKILKEKLELLA